MQTITSNNIGLSESLEMVNKVYSAWSKALHLRSETNEIPREPHDVYMAGYKRHNQLYQFMKQIEFVALDIHGTVNRFQKALSPKQLACVNKALLIIESQSGELGL